MPVHGRARGAPVCTQGRWLSAAINAGGDAEWLNDLGTVVKALQPNVHWPSQEGLH